MKPEPAIGAHFGPIETPAADLISHCLTLSAELAPPCQRVLKQGFGAHPSWDADQGIAIAPGELQRTPGTTPRGSVRICIMLSLSLDLPGRRPTLVVSTKAPASLSRAIQRQERVI